MTVPNPKGRCEVTGDNTHRSLGTVKKLIVKVPGTSLVAQRLGHCTSNVESVSSNPTQGTKIPHALEQLSSHTETTEVHTPETVCHN